MVIASTFTIGSWRVLTFVSPIILYTKLFVQLKWCVCSSEISGVAITHSNVCDFRTREQDNVCSI